MTRYQSGARAEYRARDFLKQQGFHTVIRAAGSHGPFDLVGLGENFIALVQVKRGRGIAKRERAALRVLRGRLPALCTVEVWHFKPRARLPDVEVL